MLRRGLPPKGGFGRNVLVLVSGTTVAQAIPIAVSPILTRMYTPSDFGMLAVFVAVTTVLGAVSTGRYELAIMLPEAEEDAVHLMRVCLYLTAAVSVALFGGVLLARDPISDLLGSPELAGWLFLAPPTVFLTGLFQALNYSNSRRKRYHLMAQASASKAAGGVGVQLVAGLINIGAGGLVLGQAASHVFSNGRLIRATRRFSKGVARDHGRMKSLAVRYKRFPQLSTPAVLANTLSVQLLNVLVSAFYSAATLGSFSLVQRILGMPSSLIGQSVSQVFYQSASEAYRKTGSALTIFDKTSLRMTLLAVPTYAIAFVVAPFAFEVAFGQAWRIAGDYARYLVPFFCIRFIVSSVSTTTSVLERQWRALRWQVGLLMLTVGSLIAAHVLRWAFEDFLLLYTVCAGLQYVYIWVSMRRISKGNP